ncbi:MAG TPA: DUF1385 domain-containing protein [Clostridia bacterium]|nr:DUF1385 domain-containing protein [Clostridia bacterium]
MSRCSSVGGQALIEGVMMKGDKATTMVLRKEDGLLEEIILEDPAPAQGIWRYPVIRGIYSLFAAMKIGIKALDRSAQVFGEEESSFDLWLKDKFGDKAEGIVLGLTILASLLLAFSLFAILPTFFISFFKGRVTNPVLLSLMEGMVKMILLIIYIATIGRQKDIHRVFQYHGAEHKAVFTYESGQPLTVENARKFSRFHPRCGTSYIVFVFLISVLFFSFISWTSVAMRILLKLLFLPLLAGISFEALKFTARESSLVVFLRKPGLWLQRLTTAEPEDDQLEVALKALELSVHES